MDNSKIALFFLLGLLFFIPLLIFPWAEDSYLIPKFTLLNFGVLLVIFILIIKDKSKIINLKSAIIHCVSRILLLFFFLNVISLIYATSVPLALKEIGKWLFLILLYFVFILVIRTGKQLQKIVYTILFAGFVTALWTILQDYHTDFGFRFNVIPRLPDWRGFLVAGLGNSDYVAGFLVSIFPLGFVQYVMVKETKQKIFILVVLSFIYAALIITFSVGANAGLILGMILVFSHMFYRRKQESWFSDIRQWSWLLLICAAITAFYVLPIPFNGRGESIFSQAFASNRWKEGGNTRLVIWANTWGLIKANPILGTGAGNFTYKYLDYTAPQVLANPRMKIYSGEYTNAAHNEFLHTWSELGIPGVIILLLLIGSFYYSARKILLEKSQILNLKSEIGESPLTADRLLPTVMLGATGGFTAMLVYGMMSYPLHLPATAMLFIFYLALPKIIQKIKIHNERNQGLDELNHTEFYKTSLPTAYRLLLIIIFIFFVFWSVRPLVADIYFHIGKQALKQEDEPTALTAFITATRWDNHADAHYHLGELYLRGKEFGGRIPEAITEFEAARNQRNDKYLLYELGLTYQIAEQYQSAFGCFKPLTDRQPDNPEYWERLSFIYLKLGKPDLSHQAHLKSEQLKNQF